METSERLTLSGLRDIIDERDKRYNVLFASQKEALVTAISAINKQTESAFAAAQLAIDKQEIYQKQYNEEHNNLGKTFVATTKYESDQKNQDGKIDDLKTAVGNIQVVLGVGSGEKSRGASDQSRNQWIIMALFTVANILIAFFRK